VAESPLASVQLHLVQSIDDVLAMREWAGQQRDTPIGFDSESCGLQPVTDRLRLGQLGDKHHGWAVPVEWMGAVIELLRDMFRRNEPIVCHNSSFDWRVMKHSLGFEMPWHLVHDTMILAALADPTRPKGLKPLSSRLIDPNATAGQRLLDDAMKANHWTWATVPASFPAYWAYAALDPVLTCHIWDSLSERVLRESPEAYDLERAVTPVLASMMDAGMLIDRDYTITKLRELREYADNARLWLREVHGITSLMSARQIAVALEATGVPITDRTPKGLPSVDKEVLGYISKSADFSERSRDLATTILKARHAEKLSGTYLENFLELAAHDGAIHPSIQQLQARTGRMCLVAGTLVDTPRDLIAQPLGVPIEDVKPGDPVYSFDEHGNVVVQCVKAVHDNGTMPVMRLIYRRSGFHGGELMELKATPDHRIALRTGEYRQLKDLAPGDKLGFMVRSVAGENGSFRSKLEWNGGKRVHEPRVICQPENWQVVHHVNEQTLDQRPGNLKSLTIRAHMREHAAPCPFSASELAELLETDSSRGRIAERTGVGIKTLKRWCGELGIPWRSGVESIKRHYDAMAECPLSASEFFARLEELGGTRHGPHGGGAKLARELNVDYRTFRRWKREFESKNHEVVAVIDDGEVLPVYDLEINGFPNFVANELWVHNSCTDPNIQNLPRDDKVVRGCFIPRPGHVLISCDFSQVEMRIAAALSRDPGLIAAFAESDAGGRDFYSGIASELFNGVVGKEDPRRQAVKSMSYASLYGAGLAKQALTAGVTVAQLKPIREAFDARFPGLTSLARDINSEANAGMADDPEGRPMVRTSTGRPLPGERGRAYALLNYKIQAEAAEQLKRAIVAVASAGLTPYARAPIHDELLFEAPADRADELKEEIVRVMTDHERYAVPITCEAKVMAGRWAKLW
jgi:DNA polymerase I-like protein with 3'-5' exonuclease and polymerase domains